VFQRSATTLGAAIVALLAIQRYVAVFKDALIDDAFIQLQYGQTLATSGTWGVFVDRVTNTATSPLNVVLTALAGLMAPTMLDAVVWLTALEMLALLVFLLLASRKLFDGYAFGALAFVACVANPLVVSTIGLEGVLFITWIGAAIYCFAAGRWSALAVCLALLTLTRADGALLFAVFLVALPVNLGTKVRFVAIYALTMVPWFAFSWVHLGSVLPDTLQIKMGQPAFQAYGTYRHGPMFYVRTFPVAAVLSIAMLPFGAFLLATAHRPARKVAAIIAAFGALHFIAYTALKVPPYHWYYLNEVVACALVGSLGLASVLHDRLSAARARTVVLLAGMAIPVAGIVAVTGSVHPLEVPIHSNWGTHATYKEMGLWLRDHTDPAATILCGGEFGTLAFYSQRLLINEFSDMNVMTDVIARKVRRDGPIADALFRMNYYWRRQQPPVARPQYRLDMNRPRFGELSAAAEGSIMSWQMTTRFIQRVTPNRRVLFALRPSTPAVP